MTVCFEAVLFDLDGTLVDTAPDMVRVLFEMIEAHGGKPLHYAEARASVSNGSLGLVRLAFPDAGDAGEKMLQEEYLERYEREVCRDSALFPGLAEMLDEFDRHRRPWGVVTNKPQRMTEPLLEQLALRKRLACAISGDTLPERKPHPAPLLLASRQTGIAPAKTLYVGDALRDIEAGRAAGMTTVAAAYGYITADDSADRWNADFVAADTHELAELLLKAVNLAA
jgi:2-phosphoglycolate phosphatase